MKQKVFDYIEELERKAKESEKYFKLWHEEKIKNNKAIDFIKKNESNISSIKDLENNKTYNSALLSVKNILRGEDKE